jgi:hypothetical protein
MLFSFKKVLDFIYIYIWGGGGAQPSFTLAQQIVYFCLWEFITFLLRRKLQVKILAKAKDFADFAAVSSISTRM